MSAADPVFWEGLDPEEWRRRLGLSAVEIHATVDSTNSRAREWIREGGPVSECLVLADRQTSGRGRSGRRWESPPGAGVWASVVAPGRGLARDALIPLRVGMALAAGLERAFGAPVGVKWPNDLFLGPWGGEGKVGGILCERVPGRVGDEGGPEAWVLVGVGVNVRPVAVQGDYPAACLGAVGVAERGPVLTVVVAAVREALACLDEALSRDELEAWNGRDILRGRAVQVLAGDAPATRGIARGVDPEGRLRVEGSRGMDLITAGSVRLLEAMEGGASPGNEAFLD